MAEGLEASGGGGRKCFQLSNSVPSSIEKNYEFSKLIQYNIYNSKNRKFKNKKKKNNAATVFFHTKNKFYRKENIKKTVKKKKSKEKNFYNRNVHFN